MRDFVDTNMSLLECPSGVTTALERKRILSLCTRLPRLRDLTLQSIEAVHEVLDEVQEGTAPVCCAKLALLRIDRGAPIGDINRT